MTLGVDVLNLIIAFCIGFVEWFLATLRVSYISQGMRWHVGALICVENLMGFYVVFQISKGNYWYAILYSIGAGLAGIVACKKHKEV